MPTDVLACKYFAWTMDSGLNVSFLVLTPSSLLKVKVELTVKYHLSAIRGVWDHQTHQLFVVHKQFAIRQKQHSPKYHITLPRLQGIGAKNPWTIIFSLSKDGDDRCVKDTEHKRLLGTETLNGKRSWVYYVRTSFISFCLLTFVSVFFYLVILRFELTAYKARINFWFMNCFYCLLRRSV